MQYLASLKSAGIQVEVSPLFPDDYLERLYTGRSTGGLVARAILRRVERLRSLNGIDLIWLEKEALPWLPWLFERVLLGSRVPIVSDYDDAIFHRYDMHRRRPVRAFLGHKIDRVMAHSVLVIAGNAYLAARAHQAGASRVAIVPTVVDAQAYTVVSPKPDGMTPTVGWIGTPSTWTEYLEPLIPMLTGITSSTGATLRVVGGGRFVTQHPSIEALSWSEQTEVRLIQGMDIGIMPLDDTPWSRGKCGYKLIQYMACGVPVIASPVGVNSTIVEHGVNGFIAETEEDWRQALMTLIESPDLRRRMGQAARQKVEREYSLATHAPRVAALLAESAFQRSTRP
jgi:glycosyltransferase involved in cell wall biosynthesis